jgi:ATP-dependent helicase HepA
VAERAAAGDPVRWLLSDEVGLGKTVEACLVLNHLLRTDRAEHALIVAPSALVVQWLGELYRKFHQVFVLMDDHRRRDVVKEQGASFNPFEVHRLSIVALEDLVRDSSLARLAAASKPDLLVVDEAHHLRRREGTPGTPAYRAVAPIAQAARHALLLSATPLEADAQGFFRLLQLLRPDDYPSWEEFRDALDHGRPLAPCTSATRRVDIGGFPPRVPCPIEVAPLASRELTDREDPRLIALAREARDWVRRDEKSLVFVRNRDALTLLKRELEFHLSRRVAVFHEDLSPARRDLEVAHFADPKGPPILIATECGGEGRNFQFARRLVLFDLPWNPVLVEQRIGRLDRINRRAPVEIVYFRPADGFEASVARLYERLRIFEEPLGGLDRALGHVEEAIRNTADKRGAELDLDAMVEETDRLRGRVHQAAYHHLHAGAYEPTMAPGILERIPSDLEKRTERVVLEACRQFGFHTDPKPDPATWYIEFGDRATVETLHGVTTGHRWLGTFNRAEAVRREGVDFFAAGHTLVEAILREAVDSARGRTVLLSIPGTGFAGTGVIAIRRDQGRLMLYARDLNGKDCPHWGDFIRALPAGTHDVPAAAWNIDDWEARARTALREMALPGPPDALVGVTFTG